LPPFLPAKGNIAMLRILLAAVVAFTLGGTNAQTSSPIHTPHDRPFWRAVIAQNYQVPAGQAAAPLAMELAAMVASKDPELRDNFGYEILANWIHRSGKLNAEDLDGLRKFFVPVALKGLGELEADSVFPRSFALLNLKELAAADLKAPYLTQTTFDALFELAVNALSAEKDLRGYVPEKGWAHATAHAADLLRILARNNKFTFAQQTRAVAVIAARIRSAGIVFSWGEDARLAAALASVGNRENMDTATFDAWFAALIAEHQQLWAGAFDASAYVRVRAQVNTLTQLAALVARQPVGAYPAKLRDALHATLAKVN
jgi:hypothetical protein